MRTLRPEYEGDPFSHACVMHRAVADLGLPLVQFAVRDMSREEAEVRKRYNVTIMTPIFWPAWVCPNNPCPRIFRAASTSALTWTAWTLR